MGRNGSEVRKDLRISDEEWDARCKRALEMQASEDLSKAEIARRLGVSCTALNVQLRKRRK